MKVEKILAGKIKSGDLISIVSPSSGLAPFAMHRIEQAKKALETLGFKVKFEPNALKNGGYVSGSIEERVQDLHLAFADKDVKAIICTIGGNHSNQLLKFLDWKLIKKNPKIFLGYSDITVLHHAIYKKTGLVTFYGPSVLPEFGEFPQLNKYNEEYFKKALVEGEIGKIADSEEWTDDFLDWFKKEDVKKQRSYRKNKGFEWWRKGKAAAEIFGGTPASINHLAGTEYWNDFKGKVLFLDLPEGRKPGEGISMSDLDTNLADLYNLDVFKAIKGLVIGRSYGQSEENLKKIKELIEAYTKGAKYPILYGVDIGHTTPMITLPLGVKVLLDSEKNLFEVKETFIK